MNLEFGETLRQHAVGGEGGGGGISNIPNYEREGTESIVWPSPIFACWPIYRQVGIVLPALLPASYLPINVPIYYALRDI